MDINFNVLDVMQVIAAGLAGGLLIQYFINKYSLKVQQDRKVTYTMVGISVVVGAITWFLSNTSWFDDGNAAKILFIAAFGFVYTSYWLTTQVFKSLHDRMNIYAIARSAVIGILLTGIGYYVLV